MIESQRTIARWSEETFGEVNSNARVAARANEEMSELLRVLTRDDNDVGHAGEEMADVVIVLYRLAQMMGVDLHLEIDAKMTINRKRQWDVDGGLGWHHIEE